MDQGRQERDQVDAATCTTFRANAVRLQLHALAYNLGNFLRTLALPTAIADWSLTSLREKVVKIGAKVVAHERYFVFQMAEVAVPRELFRSILQRGAAPRRHGSMLTQTERPPHPSLGRGVLAVGPTTSLRGTDRRGAAAGRLDVESTPTESEIAWHLVPRRAINAPRRAFAPCIWEMSE